MNEQAYKNLEAEWHDEFWSLEGPPAELTLLRDFLQENPSKSLYIGSGSGRLLAPLIEEGFEVVGLEPSAEMRALCEKNHGSQIQIISDSWEKVEFEESFASILVPSFTLQLMEKPVSALKKMVQHLLPDGKIYLSLFFPWAELSGDYPEKKWYLDVEKKLADGSVARLETMHRIDDGRGVLKRQHRYSHIGANGEILRQFETKQRIQWFTDAALKNLLSQSGLKTVKEINNFGVEMEEDDAVSVLTLILGKI